MYNWHPQGTLEGLYLWIVIMAVLFSFTFVRICPFTSVFKWFIRILFITQIGYVVSRLI